MRKKTVFRKYDKISITLLVMVTVIALSVFASLRISHLEEQACWETLYVSINQMATDLETSVRNDQKILESLATIIAQQDTMECEEVQDIINTFQSDSVMTHIGLLLPGDRLMQPFLPVYDASGVLSFEEEALWDPYIRQSCRYSGRGSADFAEFRTGCKGWRNSSHAVWHRRTGNSAG